MTTTESPIVRDGASRPTNHVAPAPAPAVDPGAQVADPGPLGLAGFATTTFVLSLFNAGLVGQPKLIAVLLPIAFLFGGVAQLLAGMWEFKKNNTFGAVAFTAYGSFWISLFYYLRFVAPTLPPADAHTATGIFLLSWTIFTAYMVLASVKTNAVLFATFALLLVTFALLTYGEFNTSTSVLHAGGYLGLVVAAFAWYVSAAGVVNATWGRAVLPLFPARKG